ncbi:hypothetical protein DEJ50_00600 [Streptomyces venezuelae]|uniref:Uncharacterized protein n=1 Tax=Streptomyces venezuelae TaxID=54571 RepID=A0A5P2CUG3_STRVZ|nr:hypothetical protein [Streptomyces venezuelae]QES46572.1 hypothetical protein DEJ50_00600 [Streptomyces venezuelae]
MILKKFGIGDAADHVHDSSGQQGRDDVVDRPVAERHDVDGVGRGEADEGFLVDLVGVLGLEDGLVADAGYHERDHNRPASVDAPGLGDSEALRVNVQVELADPILLKVR